MRVRERSVAYTIEYTAEAFEALDGIKEVYRTAIIRAIDVHLRHQPTVETRNRKIIRGQKNPWNEREQFWEFRVEEWRVFYDVSEPDGAVTIYTVRRKPPHWTTEQLL